MAGAFSGMDPDAIDAIANKLKSQGDQIGTVISDIQRQLSQAETDWKGQDSNKFKNEWEGSLKGALTSAKAEIEQLGTNATQQAAQQRQTSAS